MIFKSTKVQKFVLNKFIFKISLSYKKASLSACLFILGITKKVNTQ